MPWDARLRFLEAVFFTSSGVGFLLVLPQLELERAFFR